MDKESIQELLKEKAIHKSFANIFSLCFDEDSIKSLLTAYSLFEKNKNTLNYTECDFREYFNDFEIIKVIDVELYQESCELILLENKTNNYINRTIKKEYRPLAYSHENYNLCLYLVKDGVSLEAFKAFMSNIQHINTHAILFRSLNRMLLEHHTWKNGFTSGIPAFNNIPNYLYLIKKEKELLFFSGHCFDTHSEIGAPNWCSTQAHDYYQFSLNFMEKIYFHFDFNREYYDPLSLIAIVTNSDNEIINVFDKFNNEVKDKKVKFKFQNLLFEKGKLFETNVAKGIDDLSLSFHSFKNGKTEEALRLVNNYKDCKSKNVYSYFFLLPKLLHLFSAKEMSAYFDMLKDNGSYILSPNFEMYTALEDFEIGCIHNSNIKLAHKYLTEGGSQLLKGKNKNKAIQLFEQKKMLTHKDIISTFWNIFLYSKDKKSKENFLEIFRELISNVEECYTDKELRSIFVNYINFYKMNEEYMRVQFIHRLVALAYIDMSSCETFSSSHFRLILDNIVGIFEDSNCSIMKYKIEEDVLFNMINSVDRHNHDMLKSFTLFLLENYSLCYILKNHFVIDDNVIELINSNKSFFIKSLKRSLKTFKADFSFFEKQETSLHVIQALFGTLNQNEIEEILKETECKKAQQMFIDLIANFK